MPPRSHSGATTWTFGAPKNAAGALLQHEANTPRREKGIEWPLVEASHESPLEDHAHAPGDEKRKGNREEEVGVDTA